MSYVTIYSKTGFALDDFCPTVAELNVLGMQKIASLAMIFGGLGGQNAFFTLTKVYCIEHHCKLKLPVYTSNQTRHMSLRYVWSMIWS